MPTGQDKAEEEEEEEGLLQQHTKFRETLLLGLIICAESFERVGMWHWTLYGINH